MADRNSQMSAFAEGMGGYAERPPEGVNGRATYFSANNETNTGFYCSTPAESKYAQRIQQLCASVQEDSPQRNPGTTRTHAAQQHNPRVRIVSVEPEIPMQHPQQQQQQPQHMYASSSSGRHHREVESSAMTSPPQVYRYEDGSQLAYHCKSDRGEVYVSAPQGSEEARTFDDIARRMGTRRED